MLYSRFWSQVMHDEDVQNFASNSGIRWSFIIELSPWMGGFYERLVGLVKRSLRKNLKKKLLTDVQLQTLLKEVEAIINSRPLVYVGDDINSTITLTPSQFLSLNPKVGIPEIDFDIKDPNYKRCESPSDKLLQLWKKGQGLLNSFWSIWSEEYLIGLRERVQTKLKSRIFHPSLGEGEQEIQTQLEEEMERSKQMMKLKNDYEQTIKELKPNCSENN
ncbi:uncharacterized protein [Mytilus edulis]|uniref:uncharacterized protein n=1 Tax=Mytilus edulis TaxID=6550 RepID=UPI0039EFED03